jgi:DNA-binding NtrC family response regulator
MSIQEADLVRGNEAPGKPLVLLVDDDLGVLSALRRQLREEPYDVLAVNSAARALASLRGRPIEVVVSDERMPGTNGSELLAEVRDRWPWIGRVILTAYPGEELTIRGLKAGIDFILPKPWDAEALKSLLRRLVELLDRPRPRGAEGVAGNSEAELGGEGG